MKRYMWLPVLAIEMFAISCHCLWDDHVWTSRGTWFESLTLKMKIKNIDDLDENCQANLIYQYVLLDPAVCSWRQFRADVCTDGLRDTQIPQHIILFKLLWNLFLNDLQCFQRYESFVGHLQLKPQEIQITPHTYSWLKSGNSTSRSSSNDTSINT